MTRASSPHRLVVSIVAGGPSFRPENADDVPGYVIGVNDAAFHLAQAGVRVHEALSMDRRWAEWRWRFLAQHPDRVTLRRAATKNLPNPLPDHVHTFECDHTSTRLSDEEGTLNGTHSGFCALNRAYQLRPNLLYLYGFDMDLGPGGQQYWYPPYPWSKPRRGKLREWGGQFDAAARQLREAGVATYTVGSRVRPFLEAG